MCVCSHNLEQRAIPGDTLGQVKLKRLATPSAGEEID
jgi:hypothetical protein